LINQNSWSGAVTRKIGYSALLCGSAIALLGSTAAQADPLGGKEPWNFTPVNRASMAVVIKNVEDGNGTGGAGGGSGTTIVCGGNNGGGGTGGTGSAASATANSSCIIISDSTGSVVNVDQDSDGDQTSTSGSTSSSSTSNNTHSGGSKGSIDEVAAVLAGRGN
jgi:hypothetical protein